MKKIFFVFIFLLSSAVFAGEFEDGLSAYARGDYQKAFEKFELAAKQGDANAEYSLGAMFANGKAGSINYEKSAQYYKKAAVKGHNEAQLLLCWRSPKTDPLRAIVFTQN